MDTFPDGLRTDCINSYKCVWRKHYKNMKTKDIIDLPISKRSLFEYNLCYKQSVISKIYSIKSIITIIVYVWPVENSFLLLYGIDYF